MIIWNGLGILVGIIGVGSLVVTQVVTQHITGDERYYHEHRWLFLVGMLVAAALTYGLHRLLLLRKEQVVIDKATGEELVLKSNDSLFFVSVQLWPVVFIAFGLIAAFVGPR